MTACNCLGCGWPLDTEGCDYYNDAADGFEFCGDCECGPTCDCEGRHRAEGLVDLSFEILFPELTWDEVFSVVSDTSGQLPLLVEPPSPAPSTAAKRLAEVEANAAREASGLSESPCSGWKEGLS